MVRSSARCQPEGPSPEFRVEAPRAGDAIGGALRGAFERDLGLPDDMAAMLRRLDRNPVVRTF